MEGKFISDSHQTPYIKQFIFAGALCASLLALNLTIFWPGFMTPDSAWQWLQARTSDYSDVHPPIMAITWSILEKIYSGPGLMLVAQLACLWIALGVLASALYSNKLPQLAFIATVGLWPPIIVTSSHIWKDVPMAGLLLMACALLAWESIRRSRHLLYWATAAMILACLFRHNAIFAAAPLLLYVGRRLNLTWLRATLFVIAITFATVLIGKMINSVNSVTTRSVWPVTAAWDIAAVSLKQDKILIPGDWHAPDLSLPELQENFRPWSNTTIFNTGKILISLYSPLSEDQIKSLAVAWLRLWVDYPRDILWHRTQLIGTLLNVVPSDMPTVMTFSPAITQLPENPVLHLPPSRLRELTVEWLTKLIDTPFFWGWLYLLVNFALLIFALIRSQLLLGSVVLSGIFSFLPLYLIAPSAEFRYLLWLVITALIGVGIVFSRSRETTRTAGRTSTRPARAAIARRPALASAPPAGTRRRVTTLRSRSTH